jgi:hypothetical protein
VIVDKLDEPQQHPEALDVESGDYDDDEDGYGPTEFAEDEDDEFSHLEVRSILVSSLTDAGHQ